MNSSVNKSELLQLIEDCMNIQDMQTFEETKIQLILNFFEKNNIKTLNNIIRIGAGTYSKVFKINEFVIKIGFPKAREEILENCNIIKDFVRLNIKFLTSKMTIVIGFEIQPFAHKYENICEEDLYRLYFLLRKENLIWTDVKRENVGMLNNKLVIIDTDDIFYDDDINIQWLTPLSKLFEIKFNKERSV